MLLQYHRTTALPSAQQYRSERIAQDWSHFSIAHNFLRAAKCARLAVWACNDSFWHSDFNRHFLSSENITIETTQRKYTTSRSRTTTAYVSANATKTHITIPNPISTQGITRCARYKQYIVIQLTWYVEDQKWQIRLSGRKSNAWMFLYWTKTVTLAVTMFQIATARSPNDITYNTISASKIYMLLLPLLQAQCMSTTDFIHCVGRHLGHLARVGVMRQSIENL